MSGREPGHVGEAGRYRNACAFVVPLVVLAGEHEAEVGERVAGRGKVPPDVDGDSGMNFLLRRWLSLLVGWASRPSLRSLVGPT